MTFRGRVGRWLDRLFGGDGDRPDDVDSAKVEAAIRLIQNAVDEEQRAINARRLRVADLDPDRKAELAANLARLLKKQPPEPDGPDFLPQ